MQAEDRPLAIVTGAGRRIGRAMQPLPFVAAAALALTKADTPNPVDLNGTVTYTPSTSGTVARPPRPG